MRRRLLLAALPLLAGAGQPGSSSAPRTMPSAKAAATDLTEVDRYTVKPGDTLGGVARRVEVPRVLIIEANGLKAPYQLREGQRLVIPRRRYHRVKAGETARDIARITGMPWPAIALANGLATTARPRPGTRLALPTMSRPQVAAAEAAAARTAAALEAARPVRLPAPASDAPVRFRWPVDGPVTRDFVPRGRAPRHDGIDIAAPESTPVAAAAPGRVVFAGHEPRTYGNLVIIDHGAGWFSAYAKLRKPLVRKGRRVAAGERVGLVGHTGSTPDVALHFEVRRRTVPQDPLGLLPARD